jgi:hypothetical protein
MAKDWLKDYGTKTPQKFQTGGPMAAPAPEGGMPPAGGAPAGPEGGAPNLDAMLAEYAQTRDPQLAVAICDMLVEMVASQGAEGGAPAPEGGAPMAKKGAKMSKAPVFKAKKKC